MEMLAACCDKAEQENMLAWLYDKDRWSSGLAGGKVTKCKEFRRKRLTLYPEDKGWNTPKAEALKSGEPYFLACYDVVLDKVWNKVNAMSRKRSGIKPKGDYLLSGMVVCKCGATMQVNRRNNHGKDYISFFCPRHIGLEPHAV